MNDLERELDYCLGTEVPEPGRAFDVAPGIKWLRMALPFALNHINLWLLRDSLPAEAGAPAREGWSIVDCGIDNAATRAAWEQIFASELDGLPVLRVIVTHMHPDHIGAANWLCERWNARLWISATDFGIARMASSASAGFGGPLSAAFMAVHGLAADPAAVDGVASRTNYYRNLVPAVPNAYRRLLDGKVLEVGPDGDQARWTCRVGYGHAPEHIALDCAGKRVLISGDMVLPRISTNVSVIDVEPEADPLTLYLDSIERMRAIDADDPRPAVARAAVQGPAHAHRPAPGAPRGALRRGARGLRRPAAKRVRAGPGPVQAPARPAPDDVRDGRVAGAPACALVPRQARAARRCRRGDPLFDALKRQRFRRRCRGDCSLRLSSRRAASYSGTTERTTFQKRSLWFISRRWASSWATT